MNLIIENFRCFEGKHELKLAPLTVLTGENSSGKSTLMAAISVVNDTLNFPVRPDFNRAPFLLGTYRNIATHKASRKRKTQFFKLGVSDLDKDKSQKIVLATYSEVDNLTSIRNLHISNSSGKLDIEFGRDKLTTRLSTPNMSEEKFEIERRAFDRRSVTDSNTFMTALIYSLMGDKLVKLKDDGSAYKLIEIFQSAFGNVTSPLAIAPLRTKPKRTYDQSIESFSPEGDDIPFLLAKLFFDAKTDEKAKNFVKSINTFGKESGLFGKIKVKQLGLNYTDPFQVHVSIGSSPFNLADVGYGVSQSLPIIVQTILKSQSRMLLLQQPEVHLHPKAQAAMGSFFARLVGRKTRQSIVVETHSDYLIDRIRQAISEKEIDLNEVSLAFIRQSNGKSKINHIKMDTLGNIISKPTSYRDFFMKEQLKILNMGTKLE